MASSSHGTNNGFSFLTTFEEEKEEGESGWLQLGLGGSVSSKKRREEHSGLPSASSSSPLEIRQEEQVGLGWALGLGLSVGSETYNDFGFDRAWKDQALEEEDDGDDIDVDDEGAGNRSSLLSWSYPREMVIRNFHDLHDRPNTYFHHYLRSQRPHAGLWFMLTSFPNRNGEALPQIPKAYIRVKDENVTVFAVKKYLVVKLGLANEAEVEISCMGQNLEHEQTLKQVRDYIWVPISSTTFPINHHMIMSLRYTRTCLPFGLVLS
ncbi:hypothetical protein K2173_012058 [Erythroxylum novogranatense]|uniref:Uncharacterized protein n=1 Tax=Erythroxylum novogranatense TaxID=1862640 RepID=A0AAV8TG30_9ROSI|nr:hypothetical protein K2173_012058 [Erythroxylum novogranatense]